MRHGTRNSNTTGESRRAWIRVAGVGRSFRNLTVLPFGDTFIRDPLIRGARINRLLQQPSSTRVRWK